MKPMRFVFFAIVMSFMLVALFLPHESSAWTMNNYTWLPDNDNKDEDCDICKVGIALLPQTGQTKCFDTTGEPVTCGTGIGKGQDADLKMGVPWPNPRFTDNKNGTVTDNLTGLIWLKNANCFGPQDWPSALNDANTLASGSCGLTDKSDKGDWRLPNVRELTSLIDFGFFGPAISNTVGTGQWKEGDAFSQLQMQFYWSSTPGADNTGSAWYVLSYYGLLTGAAETKSYVCDSSNECNNFYVWPVRGGACEKESNNHQCDNGGKNYKQW
jgi:hypothetical protein